MAAPHQKKTIHISCNGRDCSEAPSGKGVDPHAVTISIVTSAAPARNTRMDLT